MSKKDKNKQAEAARQDWQPHWSVGVLYRIWRVLFATAKIAIGALATVALIAFVCAFAFVGTLGAYLEEDILPSAGLVLEDLEMDAPSTVYFVNNEGEIEVLQELYASTDWKKATYDEIPQALIHAAVAIEDKRFYEHQGVDWFTTIKAFANMFFGDATVGGSSITQQLIKNKTGEDSVTVQRKVLEFFRATLVEKNYDKKVIIEEYLNSIYMGQGCRGVRSAAEAYFGKELQMLTVAECASLISITNNPSMFDPYSDVEFTYEGQMMNGKQRNRHRQMLVLGEMLSQGYITREKYDEAVAQELVLRSSIPDGEHWQVCSNGACDYQGVEKTFESGKCPQCGTALEKVADASQDVYSYFVDMVISDVAKALAKQDGITEWNDGIWQDYVDRINRGGYHIYATIDKKVQDQVDKIYKNLDNIPSTRSAQQLQSAMIVIDNRTGDVVAVAGGVGDEKVHFGLNRATDSKLQSGSSIKPLTIYAPGFEQGSISPATVIKDMPTSLSEGAWPQNDNRQYAYTRTIFSGIVSSVNAVAANTVLKIGTGYGLQFARDKFGISTLVDSDEQISSLALGAQVRGVRVRDMANAFATFPNDGVYRTARTYTKVYNSKGEIVLDNPQESREVLGKKAVDYINYCLTYAASSGTGTGADFYSVDVAGKTGTTDSNRDKWFCGYTGYYTAAVWCGYDMPETIYLSYNPAANLWKKVMEPLHKGKDNIRMYDTREMVSVTVCLDTGKLATDACKNDVRGDRTQSAMVYSEDYPSGTCDKHVLMEYCGTGEGVANEFCKHFAEVDTEVKVEKKGLLKMTQSQIDEINDVKRSGLQKMFYQNNYVYLIDADGNNVVFKGFDNKVKQKEALPYVGCSVHTAETWEDKQQTLVPNPDGPTEPGGTTGTNPG